MSDPGQSGASLERPDMDRVRDLVAAGGVSVVLAQDRDRFAREPAYHYLLRREFKEHGTRMRALNDRGDESPEGELTDGILDQLAKFERAKTAERTRRGKLRKAREGKVLRGRKPPYGFRYDASGGGLTVHESETAVLEKVFRLAAEGLGPQAIRSRLYAEGITSPKGDASWAPPTIRQILLSDLYRAHSVEELAGLVSPEVLAGLEEGAGYGVWWYGRKKVSGRSVSEPDGNGGRRYRKATTTRIRPREERAAVPVPALLPRGLVDRARAMLAANRPNERKHLAREWELRGLMRCGCGWKMGTHTARPSRGNGGVYHYYTCNKRRQMGKEAGCEQRPVRVADVEGQVWRFVSGLLADPEKIRAGFDRLIERERGVRAGDLAREAEAWTRKLDECARARGAYQDQQAAGLMTLEELGAKLTEIDDSRRTAQRELAAIKGHRRRVEDLEADRDALLRSMTETLPEDLERLSGEERNQVYVMLRLEVAITPEGLAISGVFRTSETLSRTGSAGRPRAAAPGCFLSSARGLAARPG
jgi:site-specific DNA recombinase